MSLPGIIGTIGAVIASGGGSGGGGGSVSVTDQSPIAMGLGMQTAAYRLATSGVVQRGINGVYNTLETWLLSGAASDYEARVTETGGAGLNGGNAVSTWLSLGGNLEWSLSESSSGVSAFTNFTIEIRQSAPPNTVLDSAAIVLTAIVF